MFKTPAQLIKAPVDPALALTPNIIEDIEYAITEASESQAVIWQWRYRSPMPTGFYALVTDKLRASGWDATNNYVNVSIVLPQKE